MRKPLPRKLERIAQQLVFACTAEIFAMRMRPATQVPGWQNMIAGEAASWARQQLRLGFLVQEEHEQALQEFLSRECRNFSEDLLRWAEMGAVNAETSA